MTKAYAVNTKTANSDNDWETSDMADWYKTYNEAFAAAEETFSDPEVQEVMVSIWEDDDIEDHSLHLVRKDDDIVQYTNAFHSGEESLWL